MEASEPLLPLKGQDSLMLHLEACGFPGGSVVKNLPAGAGDTGQENPLEDGMAPHSSVYAWRIPRTEESSGL